MLALCLSACLLLCGCTAQISQRPMENLADSEIKAQTSAPVKDGTDDHTELITLYFLDESGAMLRPVVRSVEIKAGMSRAQAAVYALMKGPQEGEEHVMWPDIGTLRGGRIVETAGGIATVNLPARARTLPQEMLYAVRLAIASTLTEFAEISYVNVLIGGREEGLDLGATLPVGTFTRMEDLDAGARFSRLLEQRFSDSGVTLLTTLYFPSEDGRMIVPQVRSISYSQASPIEYLYTLLTELGKGAGHPLCMQDVPAPMEYIVEMPEIVRTEDGYVAIDLRFSEALEEELKDCSLALGTYMAMLTDTLMGFVPGVEGVRVTLGDREITGLDAEETPDGRGVQFKETLAVRDDFGGYVGAMQTLYAMAESGGLMRVSRLMKQDDALDPRERLTALMALEEEGLFALPEGLTQEDVLAVHTSQEEIALNLSSDFAKELAALTPEKERAAVYAMVNTLTEGTDIRRVLFFFEGEQRETLAGGLEMRGAFMRNPGMVVN